MVDIKFPLRLKSNVAINKLHNEDAVVLAFDSGKYLRLNESAIWICENLQAFETEEQAIDKFAEHYSIDVGTAKTDLLECLELFDKYCLIEHA